MVEGLQLVLDTNCQLGESPVWRSADATLVFVDIKGRRVHAWRPDDNHLASWAFDEDIGSAAPARGGCFVAGMRSGIWRIGPDGAKQKRLAVNPEPQSWSRFNDGRVDPAGRYLCGTIDEEKAGRAGLYRYDRHGLVRLADGLMTSNGLAFSPNGKFLYHADTPRFTIYRYDYDVGSGAIENRTVFVTLDSSAPDRARPDGAAVDAEGCYWSALYEGGRVHRYDPDGRLMAHYPLSARKPTMVAFGGADLSTLFVTTAADECGGPGGGVYAMQAGVAGLATFDFDESA